MRHAFGNVVNHQKVFRDILLTSASFKTNTHLAFMPIKELEDFAIKDEERRFRRATLLVFSRDYMSH